MDGEEKRRGFMLQNLEREEKTSAIRPVLLEQPCYSLLRNEGHPGGI
jgi:hypothetical protein